MYDLLDREMKLIVDFLQWQENAELMKAFLL